ncbi:hypothetical protein GGS23DRAFT_611410 [Durotheca rogersii]|uniref:uncharacterized protein n=1 Tax=Durotheca rogersii TaxID=419775 RepID=UPI002220CD4A|nr:uncharacterized protein GGS23DRAFT_611410 [Durotheca rogersii]KAI5861810.1 hypothetical protein GGS23DRAFT_611410 [Durotheca rogersii]
MAGFAAQKRAEIKKASPLVGLPDETQLAISLYLGVEDVVRLRQTCRRYRNLFSQAEVERLFTREGQADAALAWCCVECLVMPASRTLVLDLHRAGQLWRVMCVPCWRLRRSAEYWRSGKPSVFFAIGYCLLEYPFEVMVFLPIVVSFLITPIAFFHGLQRRDGGTAPFLVFCTQLALVGTWAPVVYFVAQRAALQDRKATVIFPVLVITLAVHVINTVGFGLLCFGYNFWGYSLPGISVARRFLYACCSLLAFWAISYPRLRS